MSNEIFLYTLPITVDNDKIIPRAEAMSERTDIGILVIFFFEFLKIIEKPPVLVTGFSTILLNAVWSSFNTCLIHEYIFNYFKYLNK